MPLPSRTLILVLAAASGLFLVSPELAIGIDLVILVIALVDARVAADPEVGRDVPSQLSLGDAGTASITATVRSGRGWAGRRRPVRIRITDDLPSRIDRSDADWAERAAAAPPEPAADPAGGLPAGARLDRSVDWSYRFRPTSRGTHVFGDVHLRVLGPLGLAWRQRKVALRDEVLVLPGLAELRRHRLLGLKERLRRAGLRNTRLRGEGHSFESLREYVRGDDPRTIDWKATAHRATLMVREYEAERSQSVVIALDAGRMMGERLGDRERLDHAMSSALLLADVARLHGDRVGFYAFADEVLENLPPRRLAVDRLANAMARVPTRSVEPNYPLAFNTLRRKLSRRALVVVFTDVIDAAASHALIAQLTRSAQRHLVLAVTLRNPELEEWAAAPVHDVGGAYRRAAAEEMLEARSVALGRMRRAGIQVADVTPSHLVSAVINQYLEIKYRGRL